MLTHISYRSKPFNAFSGRPIGEHTQIQQQLQQQQQQQHLQQQQAASQQVTNTQPPPGVNGVAQAPEIWVETKAEDGRSYYYHAVTRETTWTRPDGPNIKIMTQVEVEELAKRQPSAAAKADLNAGDHAEGPTTGTTLAGHAHLTSQPPPHLLNQPPPNAATPLLSQPPPNVRQQPPPMFQQPPGMQPPPGFGQPPPFCMPPPAYGFPGAAPGAGPWGVGVPPWQQQQQQQHMHAPPAASQDKPAKNLIIKPGIIDPAVIARAAEWSEHRAPDGRPYYFHAARGESVWEKPQALRDMEAARMAAHSGATPQAPPVGAPPGGMPPHLLPNPLMHMPPGAAPGFDPQIAFAAAAAAMKANNENSKAAQAAALEKEAKKAAEEKRKKEEEQKKQAAAAANAKQTDKSRPVTSTPIAGTPWCVVWTGDARVFFYNPSTRTSVWDRPEDLMNREDVDKAVNERPEQLKTAEEKSNESEQKPGENSTAQEQLAQSQQQQLPQQQQAQRLEPDEEDREVIQIRTESESSVEEVPTKRVRMCKLNEKQIFMKISIVKQFKYSQLPSRRRTRMLFWRQNNERLRSVLWCHWRHALHSSRRCCAKRMYRLSAPGRRNYTRLYSIRGTCC